MTDTLTAMFQAIGLKDSHVKDTLKNEKLSHNLKEVIHEARLEAGCDKEKGNLIYFLASSKDARVPRREVISESIADGGLKKSSQVEAAVNYMKGVQGTFNLTDFKSAVGIGVTVSEEQIRSQIDQWVLKHREQIEAQRYQISNTAMREFRSHDGLRFADLKLVKKVLDERLTNLLGTRDAQDPPGKKMEAKPSAVKQKQVLANGGKPGNMFTEGFLAKVFKFGEPPQIKKELMDQHLQATGGVIITRFPPEPNGFLHIGHSKAISVDFGFARFHDGRCYLRFDDTNPEAEEERFFTSIKETIEWLGFAPYKITHSSDYFPQLYELAEKLILKDRGYVCHCSGEEIHAARGGDSGLKRFACNHRNRPIEENLKEFRAMRDGKYTSNDAVLRMKQDLEDPNPQMWDLIAYRVLNASHHRTGDKWKIYPTYDFTHCLVDSLENITHSLCTTEFITARQSYEWLCDALEVYKPKQTEFGGLTLEGTVLSKRRILRLVKENIVRGWDDPRLYTLVGIRRRGVPPGAILSFVNELGVTTAAGNIQIKRFENSVRKYLEEHTPRLSMILDPIPVVIENLPSNYVTEISVHFKPNNPEMGEHRVPFTSKIFIDRSDFRLQDSPDYNRLAPNKLVGLIKVDHPIRATSYSVDESSGKVTEIRAQYETNNEKKPQAYIHWVAESIAHQSPIIAEEVRLFEPLFKSEAPLSHPQGFMADINPHSETIFKNAYLEIGFREVRKRSPWTASDAAGHDKPGSFESVRFQALRVGYFCMDRDSTDISVILNRIVTIKEDAAKGR